MSKETINERIAQAREALGISQSELARRLGVSPQSVQQWEKAETSPRGKRIRDLAQALQVREEWLLVGGSMAEHAQVSEQDAKQQATKEVADRVAKLLFKDKTFSDSDSQQADFTGIESWDSKTPLPDDELELPFFTDIAMAAGCGAEEAIENAGPKLRFSKSTLRRQGVEASNAACVRVSGTSMEPVIPDGATIGIDTGSTRVVDGKLYAINHDGLLRIKLLYQQPGGGLRLRSYNRDEYPDETLNREERAEVRVLGKVFWYSVLL